MITYYNEESKELVVDLTEQTEDIQGYIREIIEKLERRNGYEVNSYEDNKYWIAVREEVATELERYIEEIIEVAEEE